MADITPGSFRSRRSQLDKERALSTARNPGDSKYGAALYKNNAVEDRIHSAELRRIDNQLKRTSMHMEQKRKQFLQRYTLKEPMLIVVRPPSPGAIDKHESRLYNIENDYEYGHPLHKGGPRYMQPLDSKTKIPNYRPTIDAFCMKTKKKVNVWEHIILEKETPKFRSTVMPSYPLSTAEIRDLSRGMEYHKLEIEAGTKTRALKSKKKSKKKHSLALPSSTPGTLPELSFHSTDDEYHSDDTSRNQWHFVTETPVGEHEGRSAEHESRKASDGNTVTFTLPKLRTPKAYADDRNTSTTQLKYPTGKDTCESEENQLSNKELSRAKRNSTKPGYRPKAASKQRNASEIDQSVSSGQETHNTTAICVVHGEETKPDVDEDETGESTGRQNDVNIDTLALVNNFDEPEDVNDITIPKWHPGSENTDDNGVTNSDESCDHISPSAIPGKDTRSGLAVILEAAMEGMEHDDDDPNV